MLYFRAFMFYYVDKFPVQADGVRSVFVDHSIHGWNELLHVYKEQLSFPKWAGDNLHAFYDVMTQLYYWVPEEEIRICHNGVPALDDDMIGYLDFLNLIDVVWEKFTEAADKCRRYAELCPKAFIFNNDKPWYDYKPKNFNVYFRKEDEPFIKDILAYSSICRVISRGRCSIAQIAGWISLLHICPIQAKYVPLHRSLKHSGALLGSNSMRNRAAHEYVRSGWELHVVCSSHSA